MTNLERTGPSWCRLDAWTIAATAGVMEPALGGPERQKVDAGPQRSGAGAEAWASRAVPWPSGVEDSRPSG